MNKYSVFNGINNDEAAHLESCLGFENRCFRKRETILRFSSDLNKAGIVRSGLAYLISINGSGEESILDYYEDGNIFGGFLSPATDVSLYSVVAKNDCTVSFMQDTSITERCEHSCRTHSVFVRNVLTSLSCRSQIHIDILSQRTIRGKLMAYFSYVSENNNRQSFTLPIPLSDLAEYICADRSAMMRELKKMNSESLIVSKGTEIIVMGSDHE